MEARTVPKPTPLASGQFEKTPFLHVLLYIEGRRLSGTLEVSSSEGVSEVVFVGGRPSQVRTPIEPVYLGRVLCEQGVLSLDALEETLPRLATDRKLHGQILREGGLITESDLLSGLRLQLEKKLALIAGLASDTTYAYYDGYDALGNFGAQERVSLDPFSFLWAYVSASPPWEHIHLTLSKVGVRELKIPPHATLERFGFSEADRVAVDVLRVKAHRIADFVAAEVVKAARAQALLYCLLITKQVEFAKEIDGSRAPPARASDALLRATRSRSSTKIPAVAPPSRPPSVRPLVQENTPAPPSPEKQPASQRPSARPSSLPLAPELVERRREILDRAAAIEREDYFEMLGVSKDASPEDMQRAYVALAKVWHPDRVPPLLSSVKETCSKVFAHMTEAFQTLSDPERKKRYMTLLSDGGATPEAQATIALVVGAAQDFQKAEACFKRNDLVQAEDYCRRAHEADPEQPDYLALLTWIESLKPTNQAVDATQGFILSLTNAIKRNDRCERAFFFRGNLHKKLGENDRALRDFRRVLEINPRNIDAAREVRIFEMRQGQKKSVAPPKTDAKPSGLFGLFRKK